MQNYSGDSSVILLDYSCDIDHDSLESSVHVVDFEGASPASSIYIVQVNFSPAASRVCSLINPSPIITPLKAQAQSTPVPLSGRHTTLRNSSSNMTYKRTPRMINFTMSADEPEAKRRKMDSEQSLLPCCMPLGSDASVSISSVGSSSALLATGLNLSVIGWDLMSVWKMNGCGECCASRKHGVHAIDVFIYHNHYSQLPKQARQQWLLDYFNMQSSKDVKTGESETAYLVCGKHVCQSLWIATIGISQSFFYEMKKCFLQGQVKINHEVQRRPLQRTTEAGAWMDNFFNLIGDHMPHQMGIHLPSSLTKVSVYQRMLSELKSRGKVSIISKAHFFKLWEEQFSQVTIPKENRFTKCDICTMVKREKEKTMNEEKLKELDEILKDHNDLQMDQRKRYHSIREKAETDPSIISMIIDGMDQNKTNVPHLKRVEKSACNLWQLRTHLTGVLVHGHWAAACFDLHQWPHDPNLTMNVVLLILLERFKQIVNQEGRLPTRLFIQMDNCGRENKNKYVLAFLFLLVELEVFDEIQLGFLMKGHTHEDVDALFGNIRKWLQRHDAPTLPALMEGCKQANYNVRSLSLLPKMFNVKGWLSPFIEPITGHSNPHIFRFVRGSDGHSQMYYKQWNGDRWEPSDGVGEVLLKGTPAGVPSLVQPSGAKIDIEQLRHDIPKYNALSEGDKQWWLQFLEETESSLNSIVGACSTWPLEELLDITKSHPRVQLNVEHASEQLQQLHQSTKKTHVVRVGTSGRKQPNKGKQHTSESSGKKQSSGDSEKTLNFKIINSAELKAGDFVAVSHHYWLNEPLIGEVLEVQLAIIKIQWWCGSYRSAWQIEKVKKNGEMELHQEEVTKRQILLAFSWEKKQPMKIPTELKIKLKDLYSKLHDKT